MDWFNSDQRQMDDFVNANNWHVPPTPDPNATPSLGLPTNMEITSLVNTNEYNISDMESAERRGKGKVADKEGPKKYSPQETMWLAKNFVNISEDAIIGNQQSDKVFWQQIAEKYNVGRPRGSFERSYVKLRKHWGRVQKAMNKWNEKSPKYTGGAESTASGAPKRTKVSAARHYSSSEGGPPIDLNVTDDDIFLSSPGTQSRSMGTKAAKRKAEGKATTSYSAMPPPPNPSLDKISDSVWDMSITLQMGQLTELTSRDTSTMSEFELELHHEMI
ncbi:uncharacterized protein LOC121754779 [Salvia splendens]|uniref:uncharacterized protein LOC121754779 n=1 Tax=Salvia splendens TaxID=180675 RepID=UPI001C25DEFA|nr:uncharacterized protein LOC121754779 [Salvia splendens]